MSSPDISMIDTLGVKFCNDQTTDKTILDIEEFATSEFQMCFRLIYMVYTTDMIQQIR